MLNVIQYLYIQRFLISINTLKNRQSYYRWIWSGTRCAATADIAINPQNGNKYDGKNVRVAVFDTGISPHADLDIKKGVSFVDYTNSYYDDNGHGSHVAGIIGALDNKIGIVGVAPGAELYAVKFYPIPGAAIIVLS